VSRLVSIVAGASLLAMSTLASASAQNSADPGRDTFWLGAGLGAGSEDFAGHLHASYQFGAHLISLRNAATAGVFDDGYGDLALLYGRATKASGERYHASVALGIAVADGCRGGGLGGCRAVSAAVGLPLETQLFWRPGSLVGLGLYGFADLNPEHSFAGLTLGLQLGRLR
jgi:hypothetical protein